MKIETSIQLQIPRRRRGDNSAAGAEKFHQDKLAFADELHRLKESMGSRRIGPRSWGYVLENMGAITKADFNHIEGLISDMRKTGYLPVDFTSDDEARRATEVSPPERSLNMSREEYATWKVNDIQEDFEGAAETARYRLGIAHFVESDYWDHQRYYIEAFVEKGDLRDLFEPVCQRYHIPISNSKGWSDLHCRAAMLTRMQGHAEAGRIPVCLICGDLDPAGVNITNTFRKNLSDLVGSFYEGRPPIDIDTDGIIMDRFGLNLNFIEEHGLTWIDNLITGGGKDLADPGHKQHNAPFVQDYLREIGERKCEANALIVRPDAAGKLMEDTILRYIDADAESERQREEWEASREVVRLMQEIAEERGFLTD